MPKDTKTPDVGSAATNARAKASVLPSTDINPRVDPVLDFPDRAFGELTKEDYQELGFLCGLEVHQQLETRRKLFCRCPSGLRVTEVNAEVLRHMRPTLSEMGEYDGCALMEQKTKKEIIYLLENRSVCTYEMDDTPPFEIDEDAVRGALRVSRLFGLSLVSELQVMRKQYLDGSIPTGFQRTAMVGIEGSIPFETSEFGSDSMLRIRQLTLEEDSCREVSDVGHRITFRTDRLGEPLIETVTEPDLLSPRDVYAGGRLLAQVARVSGIVRRGLGAARQDVNVSIAGSRRVEIKGTPQQTLLPRLVHIEAYRHLNLLRIRHLLRERSVEAKELAREDLHVDLTNQLRNCSFQLIERAISAGQRVRAVRLPGFRGLLAHQTQPGRAFSSELSERVRVIACLTGRPFMLSRDVEHERQNLSDSFWNEASAAVGAKDTDSVVLVWGEPDDLDTACQEILARAGEAFIGVPSETRQAQADGTTGFERILPGPERMYPDTDTPPLPIPTSWVTTIDAAAWELPWQQIARYKDAGLSLELARELADAPWNALFDALSPRRPTTARRLAIAFAKRLPHFFREKGHRQVPEVERLRPLVSALDQALLDASGTEAVLDRLLREPGPPEILVAQHHLGAEISDDLLREIVNQASSVTSRGDLGAATLRFAMGRVHRHAKRGSFDLKEVRARLAKQLGIEEARR